MTNPQSGAPPWGEMRTYAPSKGPSPSVQAGKGGTRALRLDTRTVAISDIKVSRVMRQQHGGIG